MTSMTASKSELAVSKKAVAVARAANKGKTPWLGNYNNESIKVAKAPDKSKMDYKA